MSTLAQATQDVQSEAAAKGKAVYVVEMGNDEREEDWSDFTPPSPAMLAKLQAIREEEERERQQLKDDPAAFLEAGKLTPWDDVPVPINEDDSIDPADPVTFQAMEGVFVAYHLLDNFSLPLLRVAMPDGTVTAITDQEAEEAKILAQYGDEERRLRAKIREREAGRDERANE